jgi:ketosteroid isomerase-like protein
MAKTTTQTIGSVLNDIYDAWRAQNLDWLATYLPDDFSHRINIPPSVYPLGGERIGKKAALERLKLMFAQFETQRLSTSHLVIDGDKAALDVSTLCVHRPTGAHLDSNKRNLWTLEDGWPIKLDEYYDVGRVASFLKSVAP